MEAVCSFETSISNYRTSFLHNPKKPQYEISSPSKCQLHTRNLLIIKRLLDIVHLLRLTRLSEAEFASVIRCKEGKNRAQLGLLGRDILERWVQKEVLGKTNTLLQKNIMCVCVCVCVCAWRGCRGASANESVCVVLFPTCSSVSLTWYLAVADSVCPLTLLSLPCDIQYSTCSRPA
jgi:hypothetical protein